LLELLQAEANVSQADIYDFELHLYDVQPATIGGVNNEFIFSPRLDNLFFLILCNRIHHPSRFIIE